MYPGYIEDEDGHITPLTYAGGNYPEPVYRALVSNNGEMISIWAFPGDVVEAGDIQFIFNAPISYPVIRVKDVPVPFPKLLYASFILMVLGFWLSFFHTPALISVNNDSYSILGQKTAMVQLEIEVFLTNTEKEIL